MGKLQALKYDENSFLHKTTHQFFLTLPTLTPSDRLKRPNRAFRFISSLSSLKKVVGNVFLFDKKPKHFFK